MIYAVNAILFAWISSIWSKSGGINIAIALIFMVAAFFNAALSAPFVYRLVGAP